MLEEPAYNPDRHTLAVEQANPANDPALTLLDHTHVKVNEPSGPPGRPQS
jgi:hypothetical protein